MIQDDMIREVQELKLAGYTPKEVHAELVKRHKKAPIHEIEKSQVLSICCGNFRESGQVSLKLKMIRNDKKVFAIREAKALYSALQNRRVSPT